MFLFLGSQFKLGRKLDKEQIQVSHVVRDESAMGAHNKSMQEP